MLMPACCIITTLPKEKQISEADVSQKFFRLYLAIRFHMCFRCRPYMTRCKEGGRCCILAKGSSTLSLSLSSTHTLRLSHSPLLFYFWSISSKVHWPILQGRRELVVPHKHSLTLSLLNLYSMEVFRKPEFLTLLDCCPIWQKARLFCKTIFLFVICNMLAC